MPGAAGRETRPPAPHGRLSERGRPVVWALLAVGVVGFVALAVLYRHDPLASFDTRVAERVAESVPGWAEALARPFSWAGGVIGVTALTLGAMVVTVRERSWLDLGFVLLAVVGSQILAFGLKALFDRPRPDVSPAIPLPSSPSFPSGHATTAVAVVGAVVVLSTERVATDRARRRLWVLAGVLAAGIGLSRIVLGVHYVTDVLAGWCLGLAWLCTCLLVRDVLARRQMSRAAAVPLPS